MFLSPREPILKNCQILQIGKATTLEQGDQAGLMTRTAVYYKAGKPTQQNQLPPDNAKKSWRFGGECREGGGAWKVLACGEKQQVGSWERPSDVLAAAGSSSTRMIEAHIAEANAKRLETLSGCE